MIYILPILNSYTFIPTLSICPSITIQILFFRWDQIKNDKKPKILSLLLHTADVSHPGKKWDLHEQWTMRLIEEFFRQGDREKELGLNCSPLCDRNLTAIPESQIGVCVCVCVCVVLMKGYMFVIKLSF